MRTDCIALLCSTLCNGYMGKNLKKRGYIYMDFPGGSVVKNLSAVQETRVQSLGWEDPLEKEMKIRSSIPA